MPFRMPSYRTLKRELGEIDSSAECLELAIREFVAASVKFTDIPQFIRHVSKAHGVRVDVTDLTEFIRRASALRLIGVTQSVEAFLRDYVTEHPRIGNGEGRKHGETYLDFVVRKLALPNEVKQVFITSLDYRLYNYYRQIRNSVAHRAVQRSTTANVMAQLQADTKADPRYSRLAAPNPVDALSFDDYVLFTRSAKHLAANLSEIGAFTETEMFEWLEKRRSRQGTRERQANAIRTQLRAVFGIGPQAAEFYAQRIIEPGQ